MRTPPEHGREITIPGTEFERCIFIEVRRERAGTQSWKLIDKGGHQRFIRPPENYHWHPQRRATVHQLILVPQAECYA